MHEWVEFFECEPFGMPAMDALQANLASLLANIHRDTKSRSQPFALRDFLVFSRPEEASEEPKVQGLTSDQWTLVLGFQALKARHKTPSAH